MNDNQTMTIGEFNHLPAPEARAALARCCGAEVWVEEMSRRRPFRNFEDMLSAADEAFAAMGRDDWLEAFGHHPRIGDIKALGAKSRDATAWASGEQAGVAGASDEELSALAEGNRAYFEKFGYIFIVSASGKSPREMLYLLNERLQNDAEMELTRAATEQMKITHLRLHKLIAQA